MPSEEKTASNICLCFKSQLKMRRGSSCDEESASAQVECIRVGFISQGGHEDYYRVYDDTKIRDMVQAFCLKRKIEYKSANFIYNGKKLPYRGTVGEVGMTDQDEIQVVFTQTGA